MDDDKLSELQVKIKELFPIYLTGWVVLLLAMILPTAVSAILVVYSASMNLVPVMYVLSILVTSLLTDGYLYGILASFISVLCVNWAFTYPYLEMDFTPNGYLFSALLMLAVGLTTSLLMSRMKLQDKLRTENEKEKIRANLLRSISHDLRTPLTGISGSIGAVLDDNGSMTSKDRRELLEDAKKDAEWLTRMVENLLLITRMSGDCTKQIYKQEELLEDVIAEAVRNFKKKKPDIAVTVSVPDIVVLVPMDSMLIEQLLMNLMDNAAAHGVTTTEIEIEVHYSSTEAFITVSNNGREIGSETMKHLFDGSLQFGSSGDTDNTRNVGIGLSLCRTIVEAHGGKIRACNLESGGAKFVFTLSLVGGENERSR